MSKLERMKKQAKIADEERLAQAQMKLKETGMEFVDYELPPDEVSEKEVRRTLLTSLRTFIPYTQEWYEARAAEEEMDDLTKIRIEKVKAQDLYTLTKIGKHDEALDSMMAETNNDFFYFNKMKYKMELEGKWKFDFDKRSSMGIDDRNAHRNRLRKAANAVYGALDDSVTSELARLADAEAKTTKRYDHSGPCIWRGKNKEGEAMRCENSRFEKPPRSDEPPRKKNDPPNILACCVYHTPFCVSDVHDLNAQVKIKVPNDEALCSECYMMKRGKRPPPLNALIVPGAVPSSMAKITVSPPPNANGHLKDGEGDASIANESEYSQKKRKRNANRCTWQPNPDNARTRGYECCNEKFVHPTNKIKLPTCPWHCTTCVRDHPVGSNSAITVPNPYALCAQHYLAEVGQPVKMPHFPFPGMQVKLAKDHWKGKRHFAVPKVEPPPVLHLKEYVEPEPMDDIVHKMARWIKMQLFNRRKRLFGRQMATKIQALFRGWRCRKIHINIKFLREKYKRLIAAVRIQSLARRYFGACRVHARRLLFKNSATHIQRTWRGYWRRKQLKIDWAARRLAKFMKTLHFFKFKDAVIMIMQLRRLFKKRMQLTLRIQRVFRGYSARIFVHKKRYWNIVRRSFAQKIIKAYRQYLIRKAVVPWKSPGEEWALANCAKKLSRMLLEMYLDKERRKELALLMSNSAPAMQRLVRGFLGRAGTKKMSFLRSALRNWVQPRLAGAFMEKFLNGRLHFLNQLVPVINSVGDRQKNPHHIRSFLAEDKRDRFEIDHRSFDPAIDSWYHSKNMILLKSEKDALLRKFRNPMNGNVRVKALDEFIENHKLPCRKHGRFICGDCVFRKNCQITGCKCVQFKSSTDDGHGICVHCDHPGSLHSLCPKQMRTANRARKHQRAELLSILTAEREPDMSFPVGVEGVPSEGVIIPALTADDQRELRTKELKKTRKRLELSELLMRRTMAKSLALCELEASNVHSMVDYWGVNPISAVAPKEESTNRHDTAIFDPVMHDPRAPDYNISTNQFWSLTAKNPNKTTRDYNEKFDHNMPVPVVKDDQIVYSFEGPQIYFNLLNHIIRLDEKVHFDNPDFLKLVVDHVQLFERHWRKMVADIRTGKLDRNLQISEESRLIFESANIPKPQLAMRLDDTFRHLGFHKKVLGKDIQIKPYAQKKKVGIFALPPPRRKRSLPTNALSSGNLPPLSRELSPPAALKSALHTTSAGSDKVASSSFDRIGGSPPHGGMVKKGLRFDVDSPTKPTGSALLSRSATSPIRSKSSKIVSSFSSSKLPRNGNIKGDSGDSDNAEEDPKIQGIYFHSKRASQKLILKKLGKSSTTLISSDDSDSAGGGPGGSPKHHRRGTKSKRELLASLGQTLRAISGGNPDDGERPITGTSNPSRAQTADDDILQGTNEGNTRMTPVRRRRRGSHSDSQSRPITAHELDAVHYSIDTTARENYKHTIKMDGDRYVCPFPACGKSFHSMDAAFRHLPIHEQRTRLYAPTPLPDSHLAFYWPAGVPWLDNEKYAERAIPPGALACTVPGCNEVFSAQMHFEAHLRNVHKIIGHSSTAHGYFEVVGSPSYVPPDRPPSYVPLHWCPLHSLPLGSCTVCVQIDASKGPKQPFRFYNGVKINFRLRRSLKIGGSNTLMNNTHDLGEVLFHYSESNIGVVVVTKPRMSSEGPIATGAGGLQGLLRRNSTFGKSMNGGSLKATSKLRRTESNLSSNSGGNSSSKAQSSAYLTASTVSSGQEWRGRPVAYMTDRNDNAWVAVEVLYTFQEAQQKGLPIPPDFNKRHQLLRPLRPYVQVDVTGNVNLSELEIYDTAAVAEFERYIRWVPLHTIDRTFGLSLCLTQEEVDSTISNSNHLALKNKFFVAHGDVEY